VFLKRSSPEVYTWDYNTKKQKTGYKGYHFSYNTTIDSKLVLINHAVAITTQLENLVDLSQTPNGDTGRRVVDDIVNTLHHEFFETISDVSSSHIHL
jgi:hypothetical protein